MTLTPMQEAAHAAIRRDESVLLLSPTGSGKTLAFLLPILTQIETETDALQAIIVVPSRELASQVEDVIRLQKMPVRSMALYGGRPTMEEHRRLREVSPHLIVSTPGRLLDHFNKENLSFSRVRTLVIDEYDKCWELGFKDEMAQIATALHHVSQVVIVSATAFRSDDKDNGAPEVLIARRYTRLDYLHDGEAAQSRLHIYHVPSDERDKLTTLTRLLSVLPENKSILVFVSHRESADRVGQYLRREHFGAAVYHGGLEQETRERALFRFRAGAANILVCTDLASRGLDIPHVGAVIHYHLPADEATFTHRSGRTARWQSEGNTYLIVGPDESWPDFVEAGATVDVQEQPVKPLVPTHAVLYIGRGKRDKLSKADIVGFLCKKGKLHASQIGSITLRPHSAYVAIERRALPSLLRRIGGEKIKGMKTIIEEMRQ